MSDNLWLFAIAVGVILFVIAYEKIFINNKPKYKHDANTSGSYTHKECSWCPTCKYQILETPTTENSPTAYLYQCKCGLIYCPRCMAAAKCSCPQCGHVWIRGQIYGYLRPQVSYTFKKENT